MNIVTFLDSKDNIPLTTKYLCIKVKKVKGNVILGFTKKKT